MFITDEAPLFDVIDDQMCPYELTPFELAVGKKPGHHHWHIHNPNVYFIRSNKVHSEIQLWTQVYFLVLFSTVMLVLLIQKHH